MKIPRSIREWSVTLLISGFAFMAALSPFVVRHFVSRSTTNQSLAEVELIRETQLQNHDILVAVRAAQLENRILLCGLADEAGLVLSFELHCEGR